MSLATPPLPITSRLDLQSAWALLHRGLTGWVPTFVASIWAQPSTAPSWGAAQGQDHHPRRIRSPTTTIESYTWDTNKSGVPASRLMLPYAGSESRCSHSIEVFGHTFS